MARTISNITALSSDIPTEKIKVLDLNAELNNVSKLKYNLGIFYFVGFAAALVGLFI